MENYALLTDEEIAERADRAGCFVSPQSLRRARKEMAEAGEVVECGMTRGRRGVMMRVWSRRPW